MQSEYARVVACIKAPPRQRLEDEINDLLPWFKKKANVFSQLQTHALKDIIRNCEFVEVRRDHVIIRQFDKGDCFYIILSGRVSIYINTEAVPDNPEDATVLVDVDEDKTQEKQKEKKELDRSKYGNFIANIDAGKSFGELALINTDCVRNASIIADETTHLVIVNRELYNRSSLLAAQQEELREKREFVNNCRLFDNWPARYKRQAAMSLRKEDIDFDAYVVRQGQCLDGLYFLLRGHAKLVVDVYMHYTQYPHLSLGTDIEDLEKKEALGEILDSFELKPESRHSLWEKPVRRQGYAAAEHHEAQKHLEICYVGAGEVIGEIEHGMSLDTYAQSIVTCEASELYILDAKNFERLAQHKRNPADTLHQLKHNAEVRLLSRASRELDASIPLIRYLTHTIMERYRREERAAKKQYLIDNQHQSHHADAKNRYQSFIPPRGALINLQGPGTVFYRNRKRAEADAKVEEARKNSSSKLKSTNSMNYVLPMGLLPTVESDEEIEPEELEVGLTISSEPQLPHDVVDENSVAAAGRKKPESVDWETSSLHLVNLEHRLHEWTVKLGLLSDDANAAVRYHEEVTPLQRYRKEKNKLLYKGTKVKLKPKIRSGRRQTAHPKTKPTEDEQAPTDDVFITARPEIRRRQMPRNHAQSPYNQAYEDIISNEHRKPRIAPVRPQSASAKLPSAQHHRQHSISPVMQMHRAYTEVAAIRSRARSQSGPHYTIEEYRDLKALLKRREVELSKFLVSQKA